MCGSDRRFCGDRGGRSDEDGLAFCLEKLKSDKSHSPNRDQGFQCQRCFIVGREKFRRILIHIIKQLKKYNGDFFLQA